MTCRGRIDTTFATRFAEDMPSTQVSQILASDLVFWVNRLLLTSNEEIVGPFPAQITGRTIKTKQKELCMVATIMTADWQAVPMNQVYPDTGIRLVEYQMYHIPTHRKSTPYEHTFMQEIFETGGVPQIIGRVKMFQVASVWPELYNLGWEGTLPQFNK